MFEELKPETVVHLAAYVGGIGANRQFPADFFHRNILLTALVFRAASEYGVKKMIFTMGGCSYPAKAASPIDEEQMWNGFPQAESAAYSTAKKMGIVASLSYRQQYGLNSVIMIPGNMYGEYDNFRNAESHVIPAMIRRFFEAKRKGDKQLVMWGTGSPTRDFVYAGDVAATIPFFIENYNSSDPVNISSGTSTSIKELANTLKSLLNYQGEIIWDTSKPDGQMVKIFDVARMKNLGLACNTTLKDGLERTIAWFEKHYDDRSNGLRL
jgi:GDP-L-fucose synthase